MLNQLLKFTLVSSVLLWLKPRWKGLLALGVAVFLIHVFHGEYLSYVELSRDNSLLVWSYVLKWIALIAVAGLYFFLVLFGLRKSAAPSVKARKGQSPQEQSPGVGDGFDFLRQKKSLQNRAEMIIQDKAMEKKPD